jgi:hypothetical protein
MRKHLEKYPSTCHYCKKDYFKKRREQMFCSMGCGTAHNNKTIRKGHNQYTRKKLLNEKS